MSNPTQKPSRVLAITDYATGLVAAVGAIVLAGLVALTGVGVFFRYVMNDPIRGVDDILSLALSVIVACSLAYGGRVGAHVAVDVLGMVGGRRVTRWTDVLVRVLGIIIIAFAVYALIRNGMCGILCAYLTTTLGIAHAPFYYFMAFGFTLYGLVLVVELIVGLAHFWQDVDPSEKSS